MFMKSHSKNVKRFTIDDWIELGTDLLTMRGPEALTVEEVCESAGKTKGSFYFHFENADDFLIELAQNWLRVWTVENLENAPSTTHRLDVLNHLVGRLSLDLESQIRKLSQRHAGVARVVAEADRLRIEWLTERYQNSGHYSAENSRALARIEYAAFAGFKLVDPALTASQSRELYDAFLKFTGRA